MLLRDWIKADRSRRLALEHGTGAHPVTLARWSAGIAIPRPSHVEVIHQITGGQVTAADHYAAAQLRRDRREEAAA